jgi:hypothetical protein
MQSQEEVQKEEGALFGESKLKIVTTTVKEMSPHGLRLEVNQQGQFAGGMYNAREISTLNLLLKMDGTYDWEIKIVQTTPEGDILVGSGLGIGGVTSSGKLWAKGESLLMTQSQRLSSLNMTKLRLQATADMQTGEVVRKEYAKK